MLKFLTLPSIIAIFCLVPTAVFADNSSAFAAWSEPGKDGIDIYFAARQNGLWGSEIRITNGGKANITPALTVDADGVIWIVWIERNGKDNIESVMRYSRIEGDNTINGRVRNVDYERSYAPSVIVDLFDTPWLTWALFESGQSDIYFSRWNGSAWDPPAKVHDPNNVPDNLPEISLDANGNPLISWFRHEDRRDNKHIAYWLGDRWGKERKDLYKSDVGQTTNVLRSELSEMPPRAKNRLMGTMHIHDGRPIQSLRERNASFTTPSNR